MFNGAVDLIIRPPRSDGYSQSDLLFGNVKIRGEDVARDDFVLKNDRGLSLHCSFWHFVRPDGGNQRAPCVVYCHGNSGCRMEAQSSNLAYMLLYNGCSVCTFDFAGSGHSDGEYISLGWWERDDLKTVLAYLRSIETVTKIGLWGRSMGAATCLMHGPRDPSIAALVLDSPFASLTDLCHELVAMKGSKWVPSWVVNSALTSVAERIKEKVDVDIADLEPQEYGARCTMPALFGTARGDDFVVPKHSRVMYEEYGGAIKEIVEFNGNHRSQRPLDFIEAGIGFLKEFLDDTPADVLTEQPLEEYLNEMAMELNARDRLTEPHICRETDVCTKIRTIIEHDREAAAKLNSKELELLTYCDNLKDLFKLPKA